MAVMLTSAAAFAQGTVVFNNRVGTTVDFKIGMSAPGTTTPHTSLLEGTGFSAQIWAGLTASALAPAAPVTPFRTGAAAGYVVGVTSTLTGVPGDAPSAFVQIRAWDNRGGTVNSWADAIAQDPGQLLIARGMSDVRTVNNIGGTFNTPPNLTAFHLGATAAPLFNISVVPEPSTIALALLGGAALLFRFRKK